MKNIAIFGSGNGSNFEAICEANKNGIIKTNIKLLVCDKKKAFIIKRAKKYGIETLVLSLKDFASKADYEQAIVNRLKELEIDYIFLAGYMKICSNVLLSNYKGKIINIHPALLPSFKGTHGILDAYNYGVKVFGVTIHYVDEGIDSGKIIAQDIINYEDGDSIEIVEEKIHKLEHVLYVNTIKKILEE